MPNRHRTERGYGRPDQSYLNRRFFKGFYQRQRSAEPGNVLKPHRLKLRPAPHDRAQPQEQDDDPHGDIERWIGFIDEVSVRKKGDNRQQNRSYQQTNHGRGRGLMTSC